MKKGKANKTRSSLYAVCGSFYGSATPAIAGKSEADLVAGLGHAHGGKIQLQDPWLLVGLIWLWPDRSRKFYRAEAGIQSQEL